LAVLPYRIYGPKKAQLYIHVAVSIRELATMLSWVSQYSELDPSMRYFRTKNQLALGTRTWYAYIVLTYGWISDLLQYVDRLSRSIQHVILFRGLCIVRCNLSLAYLWFEKTCPNLASVPRGKMIQFDWSRNPCYSRYSTDPVLAMIMPISHQGDDGCAGVL
jgi:hypothetical protein